MTARHAASAPTTLTERQREVLALVAAGKTNFEIAQELGITLEGAKYHVREVMGKLSVESREEAAAWYRHQRRPTTRFATFVRGLIPAAGIWKAAAGVTAGVAVAGVGAMAVLAFTQSGPDDPTPAVAEPTIPGEPPLCGPEDAVFNIFEADPMDDITLLVVTARAAAPCTLRGTIELTLSEGDPTANAPAIANATTEVDIVLDAVRTNIIHANWTGYCEELLVHATASALQSGGSLVGNSPGTDLVNPPGCNQPAGLTAVFAPPLSFRPDLGPVDEIVCPVTPGWERQCEVVDRLNAQLISGGLESIVDSFTPVTFHCGPDPRGFQPLCAGQPAGTTLEGTAVAYPGDTGPGAMSLAALRSRFSVSEPAYVATIGCASDDCSRFAIGIAARGVERAIYFVYEPERLASGGIMLTGFASKEDALAIRRGGVATIPGLGDTTFTRVIPPY